MALSNVDRLRLETSDLVFAVRRWAERAGLESAPERERADVRARQLGQELYRLFRLMAPGLSARNDRGALEEDWYNVSPSVGLDRSVD